MASLQQNLGIATMADSLIRLLRSAAKYEDGTITIALEITLLRAYIYIQETRYLGKVSIRVDVQPGLESYETLNLLLQPVVENAIFHGIVPKDGAGTVYVDVRAVGDRIVYTVKDDGVGMGEALPDKLLDVSDEQAFKKLGLANVNRRIRIFFGDEYGLSIESEKNAGTTVRIEIPKRLHEEKTEGG
jgi:two-component system sensor histidine kinase YesM